MLSHVRLFAMPWTVACQTPLSMEFSQARILEGVAIYYSGGSSQAKDQARVSCISCIGRQILYHRCHLGSPPFPSEFIHFCRTHASETELCAPSTLDIDTLTPNETMYMEMGP